jgi:hypothetical protein
LKRAKEETPPEFIVSYVDTKWEEMRQAYTISSKHTCLNVSWWIISML